MRKAFLDQRPQADTSPWILNTFILQSDHFTMKIQYRTFALPLLAVLSLVGCVEPSEGDTPASQTTPAVATERTCAVEKTEDGALITCSDGHETSIPRPSTTTSDDGADGAPGTRCTVQEVDADQLLIECDDGTRELIAKASDGEMGAPGEDGQDGFDFLIELSEILPGERCADGGIDIAQGYDLDGDGQLQEEEVSKAHTRYICQDTSPELFEQLDLTWDRSCVMSNKRVSCWGAGRQFSSILPEDVASLGGDVVQIATTSHSVCALFEDGTVGCPHDNLLPNSSGNNPSIPELRMVEGLTDIVALETHNNSACAIDARGEVRCWGGNSARTPVKIDVPPSKRVFMGWENTCAVTVHDQVYCWGSNDNQQLVAGDKDQQYPPTHIPAFDGDILNITFMPDVILALDVNGDVFYSGDFDTDRIPAPPRTGKIDVLSDMSLRDLAHSPPYLCALDDNHDVHCTWWSLNDSIQELEIEKLEHLPDVKSISAGNRHLCALTYKNEIYCSGSNTHGQLGNPIIPESIHALDVLVMAVPVRGL